MKSQLTSKIIGLSQIAMFVVLMSINFSAYAQYEPQFTQYLNNEMFINPAYAGSRGFASASLLYRNQWTGIDGAPKTTTFNINAPFKYEKIGLGLSVMNDRIGVTNQTAAFVSYAYHMQVTEKGKLSFGLQGGMINVTEKLLDVVTIDPNDPEFSNNIPHKMMPNFGFGTYYHTDRFYAGVSIPRFIENKIDVQSVKVESNKISTQNFHYYAYSAYVFNAGEKIKCKPSVMIKAVQGAPVQADINFNVLFHESFWLGASYRTGSAVALTAQIQVNKQLRCGYSYDYTLTKLNNYTSGSHEITVGYDFSFDKAKVVTPRYF
ncbi:MAG: type IX secretion system membrane protein PorP/SprF [Bacteroidia bacterium]